MKSILTIAFLFIAVISCGQEICDNGIDDDGNGLIDLKDPGCACKDSIPSLTYLKNASFEQYGTCATDFALGLGANGVMGWVSAPFKGQVEYFNSDCPFPFYEIPGADSCPPPYPIPDGNGFILIREYGSTGGYGTKDYAATCPVNTLQKGIKYTFEGFIALSPNMVRSQSFWSPVDFHLFGNPDCNADQFTNVSPDGCPLIPNPDKPYKDWVDLGSALIYVTDKWEKVRIDFIPPEDINLILVGSGCVNLGGMTNSFFYADNFTLSETENFNFKKITVINNCGAGIQLNAPPSVNASFQWFKDSIAIPGATSSTFTVPDRSVAGYFNVKLTFSDRCLLSSPVFINPDVFKGLTIGNDTTLCIGEKLTLKPSISGLQYRWPDGSTTDNFPVEKPGNYTMEATDSYGCKKMVSVTVSFRQCTNCQLEVPSAFTPNRDGRNDLFKVLTSCLLVDNFLLTIYDRWGQKIFESRDINTGWDGTTAGRPAVISTYVYQLQFRKYGTPETIRKAGTVTLIR